MLEKLAFKGLAFRYFNTNRVALERVRKELEIISELGFCSYFLITWGIIQYTLIIYKKNTTFMNINRVIKTVGILKKTILFKKTSKHMLVTANCCGKTSFKTHHERIKG